MVYNDNYYINKNCSAIGERLLYADYRLVIAKLNFFKFYFLTIRVIIYRIGDLEDEFRFRKSD